MGNAKGLQKINWELMHLHTGEYHSSGGLTREEWRNCNLVFLHQLAAWFLHFSSCIRRKGSSTTSTGCQGGRAAGTSDVQSPAQP